MCNVLWLDCLTILPAAQIATRTQQSVHETNDRLGHGGCVARPASKPLPTTPSLISYCPWPYLLRSGKRHRKCTFPTRLCLGHNHTFIVVKKTGTDQARFAEARYKENDFDGRNAFRNQNKKSMTPEKDGAEEL